MLDLETLIKNTAADSYLIEVYYCHEDNNTNQILKEYKVVAKKLTHRWGLQWQTTELVPNTLRNAALNALCFGRNLSYIYYRLYKCIRSAKTKKMR